MNSTYNRTSLLIVIVILSIVIVYLLLSRINSEIKNTPKDSTTEQINFEESMIDTTIGKKVPYVVLNNAKKEPKTLYKLLKESSYSIIILEPSIPCNTCLGVTIDSWLDKSNKLQNVKGVKFFVISSGSERRSLVILSKKKLTDIYYADNEKNILNKLGIPTLTSTIAIFLDKNGKIIFVKLLSWKYPERFIHFLKQVNQFIIE